MLCKKKNNDAKNKNKKIICEKCECTYDENNKIKVVCTNCEDGKDKIIICEICNSVNDNENEKKEICLKKCNIENNIEDSIYITCTEYKEDLD